MAKTQTKPDEATETREAPEIEALAEQCREHGDKLNGLRAVDPDKRDDAWARELRQEIHLLHAADAILDHELREVEMEARAKERQERSGGVQHAPAQSEQRSIGQLFVASEAYKQRDAAGNTAGYETRALIDTTGDGTTGGSAWLPLGQPRLGNVRQQRIFVDDLLPTIWTTLGSIPYIREVNALTNESGASSVAEGLPKPEATMEFARVNAPVEKIAAWVPVTHEMVNDAPALAGYVDSRLLYMLRLRKEQQILRGSGDSPQIRGIYNTSGLQTQSAVSGDPIGTLGMAASKVETVDGFADGVVMTPTDYWTMVTTRHANQLDGDGSVGLPYNGTPSGVWGFSVVRSRAIAAGKALVGAFALGAAVYQREGATIRTSDSHASYFVENKLVVLAEERLALAIYRPDFFVDATL